MVRRASGPVAWVAFARGRPWPSRPTPSRPAALSECDGGTRLPATHDRLRRVSEADDRFGDRRRLLSERRVGGDRSAQDGWTSADHEANPRPARRSSRRIWIDIASFASDERRHIMRLIDDYGIAARGVIADVLDSKQPIARSAPIRRHFGQATVEGAECLDDLAGSGLLEEVDDCWKMKAEFVNVEPGIRALVQLLRSTCLHFRHSPSAMQPHAIFIPGTALRANIPYWLAEALQTWWPSRIPSGLDADAELRQTRTQPIPESRPPRICILFSTLASASSCLRYQPLKTQSSFPGCAWGSQGRPSMRR